MIFKRKLLLILLILTIGGCINTPPIVKLFKENLGKEISFEGYDSLYCNNMAYSYIDFRKKYPLIIVNYIDEDCAVCKFKIQDWCDNINKIPDIENLGYVFVFRGHDYEKFLKNSLGRKNFPFFVMPSTEFSYVKNNIKIDRQIIDGGFLINKDNKIMCIGDVFLSKKMTKLIKNIVLKETKK